MASAVRLFVPENPIVARTLRGVLNKRCAELAKQLADGNAEDWPDYKQRIGVIRGLQEAISECERIEKDMEN